MLGWWQYECFFLTPGYITPVTEKEIYKYKENEFCKRKYSNHLLFVAVPNLLKNHPTF